MFYFLFIKLTILSVANLELMTTIGNPAPGKVEEPT